MCLAIPGKVLELIESEGVLMGKTNFGGIVKQVCMQYIPDIQPGDYVLVHVGFALNKVDEAEAEKTWRALESLNQLDELDIPQFVEEILTKAKGTNHEIS
jgi:hydrogenase expression/formation protein HypC